MEFKIANSKNHRHGVAYECIPNGTVFTGAVYTRDGDGEGMFVKANNGTFIAVIHHPIFRSGSKWNNCDSISFYYYRVVNKITVEV